METEETWDTGEVRLTIANDQPLYEAVGDEAWVVGVITPAALRAIWDDQAPDYCAADLAKVDWAKLAAEWTEEWAAESEVDYASSASRQHYIDTGLYLNHGEAIEVTD